MAYIINKSDGSVLTTIEDATLDVSTSIGLVGRNYTGYGEIQNENFIFLLENFAGPSAPTKPIKGQTWYDTKIPALFVYNGVNWSPIGSPTISDTPPGEALGAFWLKSTSNQLYIFTGIVWELIGPQAVPGFGTTRAESSQLIDNVNVAHAVIKMYVNNSIDAIWASEEFIINDSNSIVGFYKLGKGLTLSTLATIKSTLDGNAKTATKFETSRTINGITYDGTADVTITSNTTNSLIQGNFIIGGNFNGSSQIKWDVNATPFNEGNKIVSRDALGNFEASNITAVSVTGTLLGNVSTISGTSSFNNISCNTIIGNTFSGNAASASRLASPRLINGVAFDGTQNITVLSNAELLAGGFINSAVTISNLEKVGTLTDLSIADAGVTIGADKLKIRVESGVPTIRGQATSLHVTLENGPLVTLATPAYGLTAGGLFASAILGDNVSNIGAPDKKFGNIYASNIFGNADSATVLKTARRINTVPFDGSSDITITDPSKFSLTGGTISGAVTINGHLTIPQVPSIGTHAVNKDYVDNFILGRPISFSLDVQGLDITGSGVNSVVSIINALAPPSDLPVGTICRIASTVQNITSTPVLTTMQYISIRYVTNVNITTTVQPPYRNNNLVYRSTKDTWVYVSS